jgi:hypothetical protein
MPLELVEVGTSAAFGVIDNVLVELEERGSITGKMVYVKDGIRIGGALGGLVVNYAVAPRGSDLDRISGALALSTLPLAMHSIRKIVKGQLRYGGLVLSEVRRSNVPATQPTARPAAITSY